MALVARRDSDLSSAPTISKPADVIARETGVTTYQLFGDLGALRVALFAARNPSRSGPSSRSLHVYVRIADPGDAQGSRVLQEHNVSRTSDDRQYLHARQGRTSIRGSAGDRKAD